MFRGLGRYTETKIIFVIDPNSSSWTFNTSSLIICVAYDASGAYSTVRCLASTGSPPACPVCAVIRHSHTTPTPMPQLLLITGRFAKIPLPRQTTSALGALEFGQSHGDEYRLLPPASGPIDYSGARRSRYLTHKPIHPNSQHLALSARPVSRRRRFRHLHLHLRRHHLRRRLHRVGLSQAARPQVAQRLGVSPPVG